MKGPVKVDNTDKQQTFVTPQKKAIKKETGTSSSNHMIKPKEENMGVATPLTAPLSPEQTLHLNSASTMPTIDGSFDSVGNSLGGSASYSSVRKDLTEAYGVFDLAPLHEKKNDGTNKDEEYEMPDDPLFEEADKIIESIRSMPSNERLEEYDDNDASSTQSSLSSVLGESRKQLRKRSKPLQSSYDSPPIARKESATSNISDSSDSLPNVFHGNSIRGLGSSHINGPASVASFSYNSINTSDFDSVGNETTLSDVSRSSTIGSMQLKRKSRMPAYPRGKSKRSTKSKKNQGPRPTAENAFETLPQHLIKSALIRQAASTLKDQRFVNRRILKLGPVAASKVHVTDFECLYKREQRDAERREKKKIKESDLPTSATFCDGEDAISVTLDSFDLFRECILKLCGIQIQWVEVDLSELDETGQEDDVAVGARASKDDDNADENDSASDETPAPPVRLHLVEDKSQLSHVDSGRALFSLGKYLHGREWNEDAMFFYRTSLFLLLSALGVRESRLLDDRDDCAGFFYVKIASKGSKKNTPSHPHIAALLTKMGDIHGKFGEINDALQAYRGANAFWTKHLSSLKTLTTKDTGSSSDSDNLKEHTAAVEGIALTHNRIGGVYCSKGELDSALKSFNQALELQIEALGDDHLEVAKTLHNIGVSYRHKENLDEALNFYTRAYHIFESELGQHHLDTVRTLHNIGGVHRRRKEYEAAMHCFKQVLTVRRTLLGDGHPSVSITLVSMAAVLRRSGQIEEANKFYSAAIR